MKKLFAVVFLIVGIGVVSYGQSGFPSVTYKITPVPKKDRTDLQISVSTKADPGKPLSIRLPRDCFGFPDLHKFVTSFEGDAGTLVGPGKDPAEREVRPNAEGEVRLKYVLSYDPALLENSTYSPNIGPGHFHASGCQLFLQIGDTAQKYKFKIDMTAPKNWTMYSSISADPLRMETSASYEDLSRTAFGGSAVPPFRFIFHGKPVSIFIQGKFRIPSTAISASVKKIVSLQRDFFRDYDQKFYNVVILPKEGNIAGMRIDNLFVCFIKGDVNSGQLYGILSHEMFHNWLTSAVIKTNAGETSLRYAWFYEGLNDYVARKLLLDAGIISKAKFAHLIDRDIINIADNPNRATTYKDLVDASETGKYNQAFIKLSYYRGALIALKWDTQIIQNRKDRSLGDLIKQAYADAAGKGGVTEEEFFALAAEFGLDAKGDFESYILRGEPIQVLADAMGKGFVLRETSVPSFTTGFTSANGKVAAVDPNGPAYGSGLREGMEIVRTENSNRFGNAWDPNGLYVVTIRSDGKEKKLAFYPRGADMNLLLFQMAGAYRSRRDTVRSGE